MGGEYTTTRAAEVFYDMECLSDQSGAGVKTFTFTVPVDLVWVRIAGADGDEGRALTEEADADPTSSFGIRCPKDEPVPITQRTKVVKVFLPAGASANVYGYRWRADGALPVP